MTMYDILQKKRHGKELSADEIGFFLRGYTKGEIPDYQASALLMAIAIRGMTTEETVALTLGIRDSGEILNTEGIGGIRVDKHSTGGVGDKTSLVVMPILSALGFTVAKMSGRGLGHTGGTVDKLEAIPGFRTELTEAEFIDTVRTANMAIVAQNKSLAPADKLLYALRDVTATVDSLPLIASSIMGKKLAVNDDVIVLDVKTGNGAFMKTPEESRALARAMVDIGRAAGKKISALVTDMSRPLGRFVGNLLEVKEAIAALRGEAPSDLLQLSLALAAEILYLANGTDRTLGKKRAKEALESGAALAAFERTVAAQGGDLHALSALLDGEFPAPYLELCSPTSGYITEVDTEAYGKAALALGAGRATIKDKIDPYAGLWLLRKAGDHVEKGEPFVRLYATDRSRFSAAAAILEAATVFGKEAPSIPPLIHEKVN